MYTNNYDGKPFRPNVVIDLEPGVYWFDTESATGKTYLYRTLQKVVSFGDTVAYSYYDYEAGVDLAYRLRNCKDSIKVLILDRYDMYFNEYIDLIEELGDHCIILIDTKNPNGLEFGHDGVCFIQLEENKIYVYR